MPNRKRILLIGSIPNHHPTSIGGTTVLMKQLLDYYKENKKDFIYVSSNKYVGRFSSVINYFYIIKCVFLNIRKVDVIMVNVAKNGAFLLSPIVFIIAKIFGKLFVFRIFGGDFVKLYSSSKKNQVIADKTFMKSDILFVETKEILSFFNNERMHWFPNTRKEADKKLLKNKEYSKKFVFISSVKQTKGINEIIEARKQLDASYIIDIYGPIQDPKYSIDYFNTEKVNYKGVVSPKNVLETLSNYDVLLLPTYHPGEGYPGIIIEAFSLGLPVITTNWQAIPEIIDNKVNTLLIEPQKTQELVKAIQVFNRENYQGFSKNALIKFEEFKYENVYKKIIDIIEKK